MNSLLQTTFKLILFICVSGLLETVYSDDLLNYVLRGKNGEGQEEEFVEKVLSSLNNRSLSDEDTEGYKEDAKRGLVRRIKTFTVYTSNNRPLSSNIRNLCLHGHNELRTRHEKTPKVNYDDNIARGAENYAASLASSGRFQHDGGISGKEGENLYRMDNTYDLAATPIHAVVAWYSERWQPLTGPKRNYNFNWNPRSSSEFFRAGVGHFTQFVWDNSVRIGCGVASTTFSQGGRKWTRTVIATRYVRPGNILGTFPQHVKPLQKKEGNLENSLKRGELYPGGSNCVNTVNPKECDNWKKFNWCSREWAKRDCFCTCVKGTGGKGKGGKGKGGKGKGRKGKGRRR